jgi:AraC family transcriptional regulator, positive regulator of tynA and feaB
MPASDDLLGTPELSYDGFRDVLSQDWGWYSPKGITTKEFTGRIRTRSICGFAALDITCNAQIVERTRQDARLDERDHFYLASLVAGGATMAQNDRAAIFRPGDVGLVDSSKAVTYSAEDGQQYVQWSCLRLPRRALVSHLGFEPPLGACGRRGVLPARLLHRMIGGGIDDQGSTSPLAETYMRLAIYDLVGALFSPTDSVTVPSHTDKLFARIRNIIESRFADPDLGPREVATEAGISVRYLQRLFTIRGTTCRHYILSRRLDHAALLLKRRVSLKSGYPLSEIADVCGFRDYTYFARAFRVRFGCQPGTAGKRRRE